MTAVAHVASKKARDRLVRLNEGKTSGQTTRCGELLALVSFYWDEPMNDALRDDTCDECLRIIREEGR